MDVTLVLVQVRQRLVELELRREKLQAEYEQVSAEIRAAQDEERILRRIAERYDLQIAGEQPPLPQEVQEWQAMNRTTAIAHILEESPAPLSPKQIAAALRDKGREDDTYHAVSAALAHLKRAGRADNEVTRGKWVFADNAPIQVEPELRPVLARNRAIGQRHALRGQGAPKPGADSSHHPGATA